jgi:carboxypeptidase C (cathepsin A)
MNKFFILILLLQFQLLFANENKASNVLYNSVINLNNNIVTNHSMLINGKKLDYTATVGHMVTKDPNSFIPNAKIFYVSYNLKHNELKPRPVTFIYEGGPVTAARSVILSSFSPVLIKVSNSQNNDLELVDNNSTLLDKTDLVFINPVGTGFSTAIYPYKNEDFWGVNQDASSIIEFIKEYINLNNKKNSPKFIMGLSYGTTRSAVISNMLEKTNYHLSSVILMSSLLDHRKYYKPDGLFPTLAAKAWYYKKTKNLTNNIFLNL